MASESDLEKVKARLARVDLTGVSHVTAIPKGMTTDDYQTMNIIPGNRIGWETRQEHLHRLSDLYTLGYLTEEEYEKRVEWVNQAQTIEQVNIVFSDLRRTILSEKAAGYLKPPAEDSWWVSIWVFIATGVMIATYIRLAMMQAWLTELILIAGMIIITTAVIFKSRK
jgi:hypothetical protein